MPVRLVLEHQRTLAHKRAGDERRQQVRELAPEREPLLASGFAQARELVTDLLRGRLGEEPS